MHRASGAAIARRRAAPSRRARANATDPGAKIISPNG
jgi:hypothetical protein